MFDWLKRNHYWMERHRFQITTTKKARIGWILGKNPSSTYRDGLKQFIETEMDRHLSTMPEPQRLHYIKNHLREYDTNTPRPNLEVLIHDSKPKWTHNKKFYQTSALAITFPRQDMYLIMDLLSRIFPGTPTDEFDASQGDRHGGK